jgi:hypothetical protein
MRDKRWIVKKKSFEMRDKIDKIDNKIDNK